MDTTYNGWANYETWATNLQLTNDERHYNSTLMMAARVRADCKMADNRVIVLCDLLKDYVENDEGFSFGIHAVTEGKLAGTLASDLLTAAFERINWVEIATSLLDGLSEDEAFAKGQANA